MSQTVHNSPAQQVVFDIVLSRVLDTLSPRCAQIV